MYFVFPKNIFLIFLLLALSVQSILANNMYRWKDESGNVIFSDQVPPDQMKHRRESLNKNARTVHVIEKEKTKAQRELGKRLSILRKQQKDIIAKQRMHDKVLLSTFRNINDMKVSLKGKMLSLDSKRKIVKNNLKRLQEQLKDQQKRAAQYDRDGRLVPTKLTKTILATKEQIKLAYVEISKQFEKKKLIRRGYEEDFARFLFLTKSNVKSYDLSRQTAEKKASHELGLFICESIQQCNKAWKIAKQFVYTYSTVALDIQSDKLIMSLAPFNDNDLSLSVSKMDGGEGRDQLFLDIRCRKSSLGDETCIGKKAKKIRQSFSNFIKLALGDSKR